MNVTTRSQVTCIPGANLKGKSTMSHERWRDPSTQWRVGLVTAVYSVVGTMAGALAAAFVGHFSWPQSLAPCWARFWGPVSRADSGGGSVDV